MNSQSNQKSSNYFYALLVDDDLLIHQAMKMILPPQWKMVSATKPSEIPERFFFHAAFVDMHLKTGSAEAEGPRVIAKLNGINTQTEIIGISGDLSIELMEACLKSGAQRFLAKPLAKDDLLMTLQRIEAFWNIRTHGYFQTQKAAWLGESAASLQVQRKIAQLRGTTEPVLISGPTGTGKEVAARLLHLQEPTRPWVAVNLGAIPENLFESELFGHMKGSFTGADQNKIGLVEAANGGDLFLDEIEALPMVHQSKLLRFLESGEFRKVGSNQLQHSHPRILAATNRSLPEMIKSGEFREDLYFRLNAHIIELPPLRERTEDIPVLAQWFLQQQRLNKKTLSEEALEVLKQYSWPGNVRELKRICEQAALTSPLPILRGIDIQAVLPRTLQQSSGEFSSMLDLEWNTSLTLEEKVSRVEALLIKSAMEKFSDVELAAQKLGSSKSNLYKKLKDYKIEI